MLSEDKIYCMSSFLSFRYIVDESKVFDKRFPHRNLELVPDEKKVICNTANDIDEAIKKKLKGIDLSRAGILLSGGMDSAILASYMPEGTCAYTARPVAPNAVDETERAAIYCKINHLQHEIVDITWSDYVDYMDGLMLADGCPVFANEPQVYALVRKMQQDGIETVIYGDNADMAFGGYNLLLSREWDYTGWKKRYTFVSPEEVLEEYDDMDRVYRIYKKSNDEIYYLKFMDEIFASSSSGAYVNAFKFAAMHYLDPYADMKMGIPLDFNRVRNGESKYLIRELFRKKYPDVQVPEKIAMARAVDYWLRDWKGPCRKEFKENCIDGLTGEQKFLVYALERFLNLIESK